MLHKPRDMEEIRQEAHLARSVLSSEGFKLVVETLRTRYVNQIIMLNTGDPAVSVAHAKIRAIDEIIGELKSMVIGEKVAAKQRS